MLSGGGLGCSGKDVLLIQADMPGSGEVRIYPSWVQPDSRANRAGQDERGVKVTSAAGKDVTLRDVCRMTR